MTWHFHAIGAPLPALAPLATLVWEDISSLLIMLAPVVAVPLTAMTFYLRSVREQQLVAQTDNARRLDHLESGLRRVDQRVTDYERDFTSKEDWLRESMHARARLERLSESFARLEAGVDMTRRGNDPSPGRANSHAGPKRFSQDDR